MYVYVYIYIQINVISYICILCICINPESSLSWYFDPVGQIHETSLWDDPTCDAVATGESWTGSRRRRRGPRTTARRS